jgi:hypothetical protein
MATKRHVLSFATLALLLAACGSTRYVMSTKEDRLIVSDTRPELDERTGTSTYRDSEGRKATIPKADIV